LEAWGMEHRAWRNTAGSGQGPGGSI
jgi:hypothetical protein